MQTLSRKRKIEQTSGFDDDDDDWGNEITAEEFDLIQSQVVDTPVPVVSTSVALTQAKLNKELEDELVEKGEIHMLRQKLEQKSRELEKERQDSVSQLQQSLQVHKIEQAKLLAKIDSLESSLKFKEHELKTEQLKVKKLETKPSQPWQATRTSPIKMPLHFSSHCTNTSNQSHISTQTDKEINSSGRNVQLQSNHAYGDSNFNLTNASRGILNNKANSNLCTKSSPSRYQFFKHSFHSDEMVNKNLTYTGVPKLHLNTCCDRKDNAEMCSSPTKEVLMFHSYMKELQEYTKILFEISTSDISKKSDMQTLSNNISLILSNIFMLINKSYDLRSILIKSLRKSSEGSFSGKNSLSAVAACTRPLVCNQEVINKSMIHWSLRVLNTINNHCSQCCSNLFASIVKDIKFADILKGSCSIEIAHLALKFLEHCTGYKILFTHEKELCIFSSIAKLLVLCLPVENSLKQNSEIITVCCNLLLSVIMLNGVLTVYNSECNCIAEVLDEIFKWILKQQVCEEPLLLNIFHLLQTLFRYLDFRKWLALCSRVGSSYFLTLDKLCHTEMFNIPALKDIIMEFAQQENLSCIPISA